MLAFSLIFVSWAILIWTDPIHHLVREAVYPDNGYLVTIRALPSILFNAFSIIVIVASLIYLSVHTRKSGEFIRKQVIWLRIYFTVPVVIQIVILSNEQNAARFVPVSVYSGLLGVITFWVIFRYKLFSIVPISRDKIVETIQEGVLVVNAEGKVVDKNNYISELFNKENTVLCDIVGQSVDELLSPWPPWLSACKRMEQQTFEIRATVKGQEKFLMVSVYPLESRRARKLGTTSILFDMTENRKRYEQIAELNQMKDRLFTIVAHDIRDPLAVLVNLIDLLEEEKSNLSESSNEVIDSVAEQIQNTYFLVENLLEWIRSQRESMALHPQSWKLRDIVQEAVDLFRIKSGAKQIEINIGVGDELMVFADRESITLIMRNLLSNAIKFTNQGGWVRVEAAESDSEVVVSVCDNGVGIEPGKAHLLFNFVHFDSVPGTSGEKGTGLGLILCKELVQMGGGRIWVESIDGQGSSFYFSLNRRLS